MPANPNDPFERVVTYACEADRDQAAAPFIRAYERGLITVEELARKLHEVCEEHPMPIQ